MKRENRGGTPLAGLIVAAILLTSMAGYVSAFSRAFQVPYLWQAAWESDLQFNDRYGIRAEEERAARPLQSLARTASAWSLNTFQRYSSSVSDVAYFSLKQSGDRISFEQPSSLNAPASGTYTVVDPKLSDKLTPAPVFVHSLVIKPPDPELSGTVDFAWNLNSGSSWSTTTNWTPTAPAGGPSAPGIYVLVNTNPSANATITLFNTGNGGTAVKTVGRLDIGDIDGSNTFTISAGTGNGILNFDGSGANAQLNQLSTSNNNTISAPVTLTTSLDITNASANILTLSSGGITAATAGAKTITASTGLVTISGVIGNGSGVISLVKTGPGTLTLSGANTYSGGTSLTGGTITLGITSVVTGGNLASGPVGTGTFNIGSAAGPVTLQTTVSSSTLRSIENNMSLDGDIIFATTTSTGRIALNTLYSGSGASASLLTTPNTIVLTRTNQLTVNSGMIVDLIGPVSGAGFGITKVGPGVLNIGSTSTTASNQDANANTYTGLTTVSAGTAVLSKTAGTDAIAGNVLVNGTGILAWNHSNQIKDTSDVTINDAGVLNLDSSSETIDALNGSAGASILLGSGTLTVGANNETSFTYAGTSSGTGGLTKAGSGILLLSGANGYTGDTTIKAGELFLAPSGSLNAASTIRLGDVIANSPSAMFTFGATGGGITLANPMTVQASASGTEGTRTILGLATNGNTNTWTGNITLNTDLVVQSAAAGGSAANGQGILLFTGGVIDVLDNAFIVNTRLRGNTVDTYSVQGIVRVDGVLGSSLPTGGSVIKEGSGTLILGGTINNYTGTNASTLNTSGTEIRGGILGIVADTSLGLAPATSMNNVFFAPYGVTPTGDSIAATLRADADNITLAATRNISIASGVNARIDSNGNTFTIAGSITGTSGSLTKIGPGTVVLSGANTYTGTTTISQGVLNASVTGALGGTTGSITVNNGGTLMVSGTGNLNRINDTTPIVLGGGTGANPIFERNGSGVVSEGTGAQRTGPGPLDVTGTSSVGLGALSLQSNATFNFGTGGVGTFTFASFAPGTFTLNVLNWTNSNADFTASMSGIDGIDDRLIFAGVLPPDTAFITFNGNQSTALLLEPGFWEVMPLTAVPEPSTWIGGALALAALGFMSRKRFAKRARVIG